MIAPPQPSQLPTSKKLSSYDIPFELATWALMFSIYGILFHIIGPAGNKFNEEKYNKYKKTLLGISITFIIFVLITQNNCAFAVPLALTVIIVILAKKFNNKSTTRAMAALIYISLLLSAGLTVSELSSPKQLTKKA